MLLAALIPIGCYVLAVAEENEDSGTTKKKDVKKAPAKMLPSTLSKHCMYTISILL